MRTMKAVFVALALLLLPAYLQAAGLGYMRVSYIEGDVQIRAADTEDWGVASVNEPLMEGDQIWVPEGGRVEMQLNTGTYIRINWNSSMQVLSLDKDSSQFYLSQGQAYVYSKVPRGSVIQIDTPDVSIRSFDKAVFRVDMSGEYQYTEVSAYKGYVETENQVGKTRVNANQMISLGQNTNGEVAQMGPPDEWERWNKSRNDIVSASKSTSSRYLPSELDPYAYDFDTGGRWVQVPDYGYCWTPTIAVGVSWAPYRSGRWIWRGGDYVWVSFDPWGWAPYHYGRWAFVARIGWLWVPPVRGDVYWGPGFVGWVRTGDYVAWVPLAPGELYYGRGYYGRHSVNIVNVNVTQVNVTNVYKNVYVTNGATVVSSRTFATASPKVVSVGDPAIRQQIFVKNNMSVGAPAIKPTRESYFVSAKQVPAAKLPPTYVRSLQTTQLKQSRPLVKDPGKSVINPAVKPKPLPVDKVSTPRTPGKVVPTVKQIQPTPQGKAPVSGGLPPRFEKGQIRPVEKKPATPEAVPPSKVEKGPVKPVEKRPVAPQPVPPPKVEKDQMRPAEKRPVAPQPVPPPKVEKDQMRPAEKRPVTPEAVPPSKVEKGPVKPVEKRPVKPEAVPPPKVEKGPIKPVEKRPVKPEAVPPPKVEKGPVKPVEKRPVTPQPVPPPKVEKDQTKPVEKRPVKPEAVPPPKVEKGPIKPVEKRPVPQPGPPPKVEKDQIKPVEKRPVPQPGPPPKSAVPKVQPEEKKKTDDEEAPEERGKRP